jgi:hypothetical protein
MRASCGTFFRTWPGVDAHRGGMLITAAAVVALLTLPPTSAVAGEPPRLRVEDPHLARMIEDGSQRSPTFHSIVHDITASNVVVYVQFGKCQPHVDACLEYVTWALPCLYLKATIDPFEKPESVIVGLVAHELRHALEVTESGVRTGEQFGAFYEAHGRRGSAGYETDTAIAAGVRVEHEFRLAPRR